MKLQLQPQRERGFFATVIMVAILGIMLIFVAVNARRLYQLDRELKLVDRQELKKFAVPANSTNAVASMTSTNRPAPTSP